MKKLPCFFPRQNPPFLRKSKLFLKNPENVPFSGPIKSRCTRAKMHIFAKKCEKTQNVQPVDYVCSERSSFFGAGPQKKTISPALRNPHGWHIFAFFAFFTPQNQRSRKLRFRPFSSLGLLGRPRDSKGPPTPHPPPKVPPTPPRPPAFGGGRPPPAAWTPPWTPKDPRPLSRSRVLGGPGRGPGAPPELRVPSGPRLK